MEELKKEELFNNKVNGWEKLNEEEKSEIFNFCDGYIDFLNKGKTEREFIKHARILAQNNGFKDIIEFDTLKPGDKVFFVNREKRMYLHATKLELVHPISSKLICFESKVPNEFNKKFSQ